nr:hypothetical protein [Tanacetum cinerariifolium]
YLDHGDPAFPCESCGALLWHAETCRRATDALGQSYSICCSRGKVKLGTELKEPPQLLKDLITNEYHKSASFINNIRRYNSMFSFTSMGGKVDDIVNYRCGSFCYLIHGENYHRVGSLLPETGNTPMFAQLYIFDTDNEILNRIKVVRNRDGRQYNLPTAYEVASLIVGIRVTMKEWFSYRVQEREKEFSMMLDGRRLFQRFLVEGYTMIEVERMSFNRKQQKELRSETYSKLAKLVEDLNHEANYVRNLKSEDRPYVMTRVFKIKLDSLMKDLKERHIFGHVKGAVYTIEFKKKGLPHCHILLWLEHEDKITITAKIDKYISSEIPNKNEDPELYQIVTEHMMNVPCGADNPSCPCTVDYKCTKKFPKQFNEATIIDDNGYAIYKRRNDGNTITKSGTNLHNGFVDEQSVTFDATESIDYTLEKSSVNETKFVQWMELNKIDDFTSTLLYAEIPRYMFGIHRKEFGTKEKEDLVWEVFIMYPHDGDACYARGLFQDDKEYMDVCRGLNSYGKKTWHVMAQDVENVEHIKQNKPGGRTAHSQFAIPINILEDSMCHIPADSDLADLIRQAKLIIWDEAPMIQSYCYEAFDRALRDICRSDPSQPLNRVFGGKVVLFRGEERLYKSSDYVFLVDDDTNFDESIYTTDLLNGLCNGTRLQVLRMEINVIEGKIISGGNVAKICAIPRKGGVVFTKASILTWTVVCRTIKSQKQTRIEGSMLRQRR